MFSFFAGRQNPLPPPANPDPAAQPPLPTSIFTTKSSAVCITASAICGHIASTFFPPAINAYMEEGPTGKSISYLTLSVAGALGSLTSSVAGAVYETNHNPIAALMGGTIAGWAHLYFTGDPTPIAFIEGIAVGVAVDTTIRALPIVKDCCEYVLSSCRAALWGPTLARRAPANLQQVVVQNNPPIPPVDAALVQPGENPAAQPLLGPRRQRRG